MNVQWFNLCGVQCGEVIDNMGCQWMWMRVVIMKCGGSQGFGWINVCHGVVQSPK